MQVAYNFRYTVIFKKIENYSPINNGDDDYGYILVCLYDVLRLHYAPYMNYLN